MTSEQALINSLFSELRKIVREIGYTEAERRIGISKSILSRWYSPYRSAHQPNESFTGPPRNPHAATLIKLAGANIEPISSIATRLLRDRKAAPATLPYNRAAAILGIDSSLPVTLASMLIENAS